MSRLRGCGWLLGILVVVAVGCSDSTPAPATRKDASPIDPATVGKIAARVSYQGDVPPPKPIVMSSAPQCALGHQEPVYDESLLVDGGHVRNAVVWIEKGLEKFSFTAPTDPVMIDQAGCVYEPHVAVAMVGQPVEFRNSDTEAHNVHGFPNVVSAWNFILSRKGAARTVTFDQSEVGVRVGCDIHPWMRGYLAVTEHPYAAVTGADGSVTLDGIPPGDYTVAAWHETLGKQTKQVSLPAKGSVEVDFTFSK